MRQDAGITGRDGYIMAQSLYMACRYQESLQEAGSLEYEWSNHQDMKAILSQMFSTFAELFVATDTFAGRKPANLVDEKRAPTPKSEAAEEATSNV